MALRSARRRNLFLNTLRKQTQAYMGEQNKALKQQLRKIIVNTKNVIKETTNKTFSSLKKNGVVRYYHRGREIKENDSKFGQVYASSKTISKKMQDNLKLVADKYIDKIFAKSQQLVPVDKRYAFKNLSDKTSVYVKSYRNRQVISISDISKIDFDVYSAEYKGLRNFRRAYEEGISRKEREYFKNIGVSISAEELSVGYGWYEGERADFIRKYLSGTNLRGQHNIFYDQKTNQIYQRRGFGVLDFTPSGSLSLNMKGKKKRIYDNKTINVKSQPTGGYQELKSGGEIIKSGEHFEITYSAYDETRPKGNRYNYAALQHDNLAFKHKFGQALYLSKPFEMYKAKMLKELKEVGSKTFERGK